MTDLTEQYRKGELELDKNYYIELEDGTIEIQMFVGGFLCRKDNEVKEVLNKVPSYDEWQAKLEENTKLKELLKECRDEIDYLRKHYKGNIDHLKNNTRLDKEINQVLGEDK